MKQGRVIINRNICDNAQECSGIAICPTGALYWDEDKGEIAYNPDVCIDCGACADASAEGCPIGAIRWAADDEEYQKIQDEVNNETMSLAELEVERYGASPIEPFIKVEDVKDFISTIKQKYLVLELFNDDSINCLLHSIRVDDIKKVFNTDVCYKKVQVDDVTDFSFAAITELPSLVIMRGMEVLSVVAGYYDDEKKLELLELIQKAIISQ